MSISIDIIIVEVSMDIHYTHISMYYTIVNTLLRQPKIFLESLGLRTIFAKNLEAFERRSPQGFSNDNPASA